MRSTDAAAVRWLDAALVLAFAFVVHVVFGNFDHGPIVDELFHILAAHSWLDDGTFAIADGEYRRGRLFTAAIGMVFWIFGENVAYARGFSAAVGIAWVLSLFLFVRHVGGRTAGYLAAFMLCMDPTSYFLFHFVRFYAFQGLCFFLSATATYILVTQWAALHPGRRFGLALAAGLLLGLSVHLQVVTLGGFVGLALWVLLECGGVWFRRLGSGRARYFVLFAILAAGVAAIVVALSTGVLRYIVWAYTTAALWNAGPQDNFLYYSDHFVATYPVLWGLFPVALLFALVRRTSVALFFGCIFASVFLIQSGGAMKAPRYMFYAMPFFFAVWAIAIAEALPFVQRLAGDATRKVLPGIASRLGHAPAALGLLIAVGFILAASPALRMTLKDMRTWPDFPSHPDSTWREARTLLQPWLNRASVILTTNDVSTIYYFGGYDYQISRYRVTETDTKREFGRDPRTGRWTISEPKSVSLVLSCYPTGLFVGDPFQWRHAVMGTSNTIADLIEAQAERVPLPAHIDIRAYFWEHASAPENPDCGNLPDIGKRP